MAVDEDRVKAFYKLTNKNPEDPNLKEAYEIIVSLRKWQGQYQRWNDEYRKNKKELKEEIIHLSEENQQLEQQVVTIAQVNNSLQFKLTKIKQEKEELNYEMEKLTYEKQRILTERDRIKNELRKIETEVEMIAIKVKQTNSLYGKFTIVWQFLQSVFFSNDPKDFGTIDNTLPGYEDKPQMKTDPGSIGRDLLDK